MVARTTFDFKEYVASRRQLVDGRLKEYLAGDDPPVLWEAMRYSVLSGGKRIRALLCLAACEAVRPDALDLAFPCACAIELIHAMSLIHDDLPCLDNDDLRRGRPTNHKVFGEAIALLAGDALLVLATQLLIEKTPGEVGAETVLAVASELARAAGAEGMVGGQVEDMSLTGPAKALAKQAAQAALESMHRRKTGALFSFSTWSGARLSGASQPQLRAFSRFGELLGLAFQITDDLLDLTGDAHTLGKTPGKDEAAGKTTWVTAFGVERSRDMLCQLEAKAGQLLADTALSGDALAPLQALLEYAIHRRS